MRRAPIEGECPRPGGRDRRWPRPVVHARRPGSGRRAGRTAPGGAAAVGMAGAVADRGAWPAPLSGWRTPSPGPAAARRAPSPTRTPTSPVRCSRAPSSSCRSCPGSPTNGRRSPCWAAASPSSSGSSSPRSRFERRSCGSGRRGRYHTTVFGPVALVVRARRAPALRRRRLALRRQRPLPWRRRAALSRAGAEPLAGPRLQDREQPRPRRHARVLPDAAPAALSRTRPRRRDLLDPPRRPGARGGADLCRGRLLRGRGFSRLLRRGRGRRLVARGAAAHRLGARRDPRVGRRRRLRAVRLQQPHRLSRDPGRGVRDGRLPDRHAARQSRTAPRARRGLRHGAGAAAVAEQQVLADDGGDCRARAGPSLAPDDRRRRDWRDRGHVSRPGRPVRTAHPRVARAGPADGRQRRDLDGVLLLDLGLAIPVGGLRHAALRRLGVLHQGRPWPAVRPGIRDRPGGADLRGVAGRAGGDAVVRRARAPRRRGDRRDLRRAADPGRRLPPVVRRIRRHRTAGDRGDPAARPPDRLAGAPHAPRARSPPRR